MVREAFLRLEGGEQISERGGESISTGRLIVEEDDEVWVINSRRIQ